jgi:hypothetical protein
VILKTENNVPEIVWERQEGIVSGYHANKLHIGETFSWFEQGISDTMKL